MSHEIHRLWLRISGISLAFFGPVFFLGTMEGTSEPVRWSLDLLSWPIDGVQSYDDPTLRFVSALTGGFLLGWGLLIVSLSGKAYSAAPDAVRRSVLVGYLSWFVLDSVGSVTSGNPSNAAFNVIVLLYLVGPMWVSAEQNVYKE